MVILLSDMINCYTCSTIPSFLKVGNLPLMLSSYMDTIHGHLKILKNFRKGLLSLNNHHHKLFVRLTSSMKHISQSVHKLVVRLLHELRHRAN
ncbi:hypothetical protein CEXT_40821 [Caerostris extrusa]|uniref:Uncharacterized protein n=1 Tax=Caerostris extrusa TaxID=172846 RepID=A0AAV4Y4G1_CAEEX|nr:hypothetical protein CEXT_40821 [Caerostris extrusa]